MTPIVGASMATLMQLTAYDLWDFQREAVDQIKIALPRNPILVSPTGSGKTTMGAALTKELDARVLWIAHRRELIFQAQKRLEREGLDVGLILSGEECNPDAQVLVASVQTLARRELPTVDLLVIDECHHATAKSYNFLVEGYAGIPRIGLTATPFRLDGKGLGDMFGEIVVAAHADELVEQGYLVRPRVFAPASPDMKGVKRLGGDFNLQQLAERVDDVKLVADIVEQWCRRCAGMRTVVFAVNVEHSRHIVERFIAAGVRAEHVDGETPRQERDAILARLASGETAIVSNCQLLTEGWDLPALEAAIIARPTASLGLHQQMVGRVVRACEGKDGAVVLDHAGNHLRLGHFTQRIDYTLEGRVTSEREKRGEATDKTCPKCDALLALGTRVCSECGHQFFAATPVEADGDLEEHRAPRCTNFAEKAVIWSQLERERIDYGYRPFWSEARYKDLLGQWPVVVNGQFINPATATKEHKRGYWWHLEHIRSIKGYARGWSAHRYREVFGVWPKGVKS